MVQERTYIRAVQSLHRCLGRGMSTRAEMGLDAMDASFIVTAYGKGDACIRKRRCLRTEK